GLLGEARGGVLGGTSGLLGLLRAYALVVVVDRDRQCALGGLLADDVLLEEVEDLPRGGQRRLLLGGGLGGLDLLGDDLVAQLDALLADVHPGAGDQPLDLLLRLPAEGAFEHVGSIARTRHVRVLSSGRQQCAPRFPRERSPGPCEPSPWYREELSDHGRRRSGDAAAEGARALRSGEGSLRELRRWSLTGLQDLVDEAVLERGLRREDLVALDVRAHLLLGAAGVERQGLLEPFAHAHDLVGLDLQVGGLPAPALAAHRGLMDEDPGVGQ